MPETPLDILQGVCPARTRRALQQLAARAEPEMLGAPYSFLAIADTIYIAGLRRSLSVAAYLTYALSHWCLILLDGMGGIARADQRIRRATLWCRSASPHTRRDGDGQRNRRQRRRAADCDYGQLGD